VNELEPTPLEAVEDMLTPVAAMVNPGVAAGAPIQQKTRIKASGDAMRRSLR